MVAAEVEEDGEAFSAGDGDGTGAAGGGRFTGGAGHMSCEKASEWTGAMARKGGEKCLEDLELSISLCKTLPTFQFYIIIKYFADTTKTFTVTFQLFGAYF